MRYSTAFLILLLCLTAGSTTALAQTDDTPSDSEMLTFCKSFVEGANSRQKGKLLDECRHFLATLMGQSVQKNETGFNRASSTGQPYGYGFGGRRRVWYTDNGPNQFRGDVGYASATDAAVSRAREMGELRGMAVGNYSLIVSEMNARKDADEAETKNRRAADKREAAHRRATNAREQKARIAADTAQREVEARRAEEAKREVATTSSDEGGHKITVTATQKVDPAAFAPGSETKVVKVREDDGYGLAHPDDGAKKADPADLAPDKR